LAHKVRSFACARFRHDRVRLLTRRGYDWTKRFPQVVEAVMRLPVSSILIESEGSGCGANGGEQLNIPVTALFGRIRLRRLIFLGVFRPVSAHLQDSSTVTSFDGYGHEGVYH